MGKRKLGALREHHFICRHGLIQDGIQNFFTFYENEYLPKHSHPLNKRLHRFGLGSAWILLIVGILVLKPFLMWMAFPIGYGCAWIGHFFIQKNKPATFQHPLKSFLADHLMLFGWNGAGKPSTSKRSFAFNPRR